MTEPFTTEHPLWSANDRESPWISIGAGGVMATLRPDGSVTFGPQYNPTEVARAFWQSLAAGNPCLARAEKAEAEVERLRAALEWIVAVTAYSTHVDPSAEGPARGFVVDLRKAHRFARRALVTTSDQPHEGKP